MLSPETCKKLKEAGAPLQFQEDRQYSLEELIDGLKASFIALQQVQTGEWLAIGRSYTITHAGGGLGIINGVNTVKEYGENSKEAVANLYIALNS